jgi:hypothetical protein
VIFMPDFMPGDIVVYDDHTHYIGYVMADGEEAWYRWPAAEGGWAQRKVCPAPDADSDRYEYGGDQAQLALKLSGVEGTIHD